MKKYAAFLRGINVGGRIIKMADLKAAFEAQNLEDVRTVLQSGNVVFSSEKNAAQLKKLLEKKLGEQFKYPAKVQVVELAALQNIIEANPFKNAPADYYQYVIFFENGLEKDFAKESIDLDPEIETIAPGKGVIYWRVPKGMTLKTRLGKTMAKAKYKESTTNRNVNTLRKIASL